MKNLIITFLFSAISFCCLAQTDFTEKTMQDMAQRIIADYPKYLNEEISSDFMFVIGEGQVATADRMRTALKDSKILEWNISDLKLKKADKLVIATGINKHTALFSKNGSPQTYTVRFSYTYEYVKGKWLWTQAQHTHIQDKEEKPEEIVKQWVAEYNKDTKAFFIDKCTDDFIASNTNNGGKFFGKEFVKGLKEGQPADAEISDMKSFKSGDLAVVMGIMTWHHKQADGSDKPDKTISTFVMQKKSGKWLYAGYHSSALKE